MKQFNLEEYLANPSRKVVTRDGNPARIICTDAKSEKYQVCTDAKSEKYQVVALVTKKDEIESLATFDTSGKYWSGCNSHLDLFFAPEKKEGWINIFKGDSNDKRFLGHTRIFKTKENAEEAGEGVSGYITTIKIEWEEE